MTEPKMPELFTAISKALIESTTSKVFPSMPQRAPKRKMKPNKASRQWSSAGLKK